MTEQEKQLVDSLAAILTSLMKQAEESSSSTLMYDGYICALIDVRYTFAAYLRQKYGNNAAIDFHEQCAKA